MRARSSGHAWIVSVLVFALMNFFGCKDNEREQEMMHDIQTSKEILKSYHKKKGDLYKDARGDVRLGLGYIHLELSNEPNKNSIYNFLPIERRFRHLVRIVEFIEDIEEYRERDPKQESLYRNAKNTVQTIFKDSTQLKLVKQYDMLELKKSFIHFSGAWSNYRDFKEWLEP